MIVTATFVCTPETELEMKVDFGQKCVAFKDMIEMVNVKGGFGLPESHVKLRWLFDGGKVFAK
jgi:hypothetical protein